MTYDPELIERLVREARVLCDEFKFRVGEPSAAIDAHRHLRAMADQLEAARAEIARLYTLAIEQGERAFLAEQEVERLRDLTHQLPSCDHCGERPGACFGRYEDDGDPEVACDECCGHGNEDGWCVQLVDLPGWAATVNRTANTLREERDRMRPVVEAAETWRDVEDGGDDTFESDVLMRTVDAYRAAKGKPVDST